MKIALDYDGTYTQDPGLWDRFIADAQKSSHSVTIVTMRFEEEPTEIPYLPHVYTGRKAKIRYCAERNIKFDIWIDDNPHWLLVDA